MFQADFPDDVEKDRLPRAAVPRHCGSNGIQQRDWGDGFASVSDELEYLHDKLTPGFRATVVRASHSRGSSP